jgi:hypothetical protein
MSKALRITFLVHAIIALVLGLALLIIPGQFLNFLNWRPNEPLISRLFGAALLALAWGSFRGWQSSERAQVKILIEIEAVFTVLGSIGLLRHLFIAYYPPIVWATLLLLVVFAIAWIYFLLKKE